MRFNVSRHTPKRCDCPFLPEGADPAVGGDWVRDWGAQDCKCCLHARYMEGWNPEWCQPCIRTRFPVRLYAEWELMCRVVKKSPFGVVTPMGGSVQVEYGVDESAFAFWARLAGIRQKRWMGLIDAVEGMHGKIEHLKDGKFAFTAEEYAELVGDVGADGGSADSSNR